jgi:hypothetical protein
MAARVMAGKAMAERVMEARDTAAKAEAARAGEKAKVKCRHLMRQLSGSGAKAQILNGHPA